MSIRIGIMGYGNLGRGVECAIKHNPDMELVAVFTRRDPETLKILTETAGVYRAQDAEKMKDKIDVLILCGGSATDLPVQTPKYAQWFNVVDSFDTHARIPEHFDDVDRAAAESGHVGIISVGWDPGMFSLNRMYANAILTNGKDYTFWGKGVSQGHSDAIRRIEGVKDGSIFARYVANSLTGKDLFLAERKADIYGNCIINDIARLFIPEGIEEFVSIGSITRDDVLRAHIEEESITGYWYVKADVEMGDGLGIVYRDEMNQFNIMSDKGFNNKDPYKASVRPAVTVRLVNA